MVNNHSQEKLTHAKFENLTNLCYYNSGGEDKLAPAQLPFIPIFYTVIFYPHTPFAERNNRITIRIKLLSITIRISTTK